MSLVEKIASRKGEKSVDIMSKRERRVPRIESEGLEVVFATENAAGSRHSIAICELDTPRDSELPTDSARLTERMSRPRRKKNHRTKNHLGTVKGEETYTETRTNLGMLRVFSQFLNLRKR